MQFAPLCFLLSLLAAPPRFGDDFHEVASSSGTIYWKGLSQRDVDWASLELPKSFALARERLGCSVVREVTTVLVPNRFEMRRFLEREGIATSSSPYWQPLGVTVTSIGLVVIRWDHLSPSESLAETFVHEAAHVVMHPSNCSRLPRWLDEGLAQWASGRRLSEDEVAYLALLARVGGLYPFEALQARFPQTHELSSIAYQESLLFVQHFAAVHGEQRIPGLLEACCRHESANAAFRKLLGKDLTQVEREFQAWTLGQASWGAALASIVNLWTLSGLLALAAVLRHWLRRRRRLRAMGAQETREAVDTGTEVEAVGPGESEVAGDDPFHSARG